jgi:hypothetical protein
MDDERPTLKNIAKEFATPGYWDRARERKASTKTVWDLIFTPIGFVAIGGYWYVFAKSFQWLHLLMYPADNSRLQTLTSGPMTVAQALIFIVPIFSSVPLSFITSNALMWLVPPARRASARKAGGVKWASFRESQLALFKLALVLVPIGLVSGIIGALILGH